MNIFISWSGNKSQALAELLKDWIPKVIQAVNPWISSEDIERGAQWFMEIQNQLESMDHGVFCITSENLNAPWLYFEAGALSKGLKTSRLFTILLDIESEHVKGPLAQFNHTVIKKNSLLKLIKSINNGLDQKLDNVKLTESFNMFWPQFEEGIESIRKRYQNSIEIDEKNDGEGNDEVLNILRNIEKSIKQISENDAESKISSNENRDKTYKQEDQLQKRTNIAETWSRVTKTLFESKYPDLDERIIYKLSNLYLPANHDYLIEEMYYEIIYSWVDPNDKNNHYVKIDELENITIKQNNADDAWTLKFRTSFDLNKKEEDSSRTKSSYTLNSISINDKEYETGKYLHLKKDNSNLIVSYKNPIKVFGEKEYKIIKSETKIYSIKTNTFKSYRSIMFNKKLEVDIRYPKDMKIEFLEMGTRQFEDIYYTKVHSENRIRKSAPEVLFPRQGFCLIINRC